MKYYAKSLCPIFLMNHRGFSCILFCENVASFK